MAFWYIHHHHHHMSSHTDMITLGKPLPSTTDDPLRIPTKSMPQSSLSFGKT